MLIMDEAKEVIEKIEKENSNYSGDYFSPKNQLIKKKINFLNLNEKNTIEKYETIFNELKRNK
jgi:hypothetical protein